MDLFLFLFENPKKKTYLNSIFSQFHLQWIHVLSFILLLFINIRCFQMRIIYYCMKKLLHHFMASRSRLIISQFPSQEPGLA